MATMTSINEHMIRNLSGIYEMDVKETLEIIRTGQTFLSFGEGIQEFVKDDKSDLTQIKSVLKKAKYADQVTNKKSYFFDHKTIDGWFEEIDASLVFKNDVKVSRKNAIKLCFFLELNTVQSERFLTKACKQDPFSIKSAAEIIFSYCITHSLPYGEALCLLKTHDTDLYERWIGRGSLYSIPISETKKEGDGHTNTLHQNFANIEDTVTLLCILDKNRSFLDGYSHSAIKHYHTLRTELDETITEYIREFEPEIYTENPDGTKKKDSYIPSDRNISPEDIIYFIYTDLSQRENNKRNGKQTGKHRGDKIFPTLKKVDLPKDVRNSLIPNLKTYDKMCGIGSNDSPENDNSDNSENTIGFTEFRQTMLFLYFVDFFYLLRLDIEKFSQLKTNDEIEEFKKRHKYLEKLPEERLEIFIHEADAFLYECGMANLYPRSRFDFLLERSVYMDDPIDFLDDIVTSALGICDVPHLIGTIYQKNDEGEIVEVDSIIATSIPEETL